MNIIKLEKISILLVFSPIIGPVLYKIGQKLGVCGGAENDGILCLMFGFSMPWGFFFSPVLAFVFYFLGKFFIKEGKENE